MNTRSRASTSRRSRSATVKGFERDLSRLRVQLSVQLGQKGTRVISMFGMTPGAGVTTIAMSCAQEMASLGEPVVLIDANVAAPAIHEKLGIDLTPGTAEVLGSPEKAALMFQERQNGHLRVLPCGEWQHPDAPSVPGRWVELMDYMRKRGEVVFIDGGTEGAPNTAAIAAASDGVMLVVEAGRSRWEQVTAFWNRMDALGVAVLGAVVNKRRFPIPAWIYRYL